MPAPEQLIALAAPDVKAATRAYLQSRNAAAFQRAMERALAKAHTAASIRGIADRTGIMPKGLSKAERADIKAKVAGQLEYLRKFVQVAPDLSDAQVAQRAALYVGAVRSSYYGAWTNNALPIYPGECPQCYGNCRCSIEQKDDAFYWNSVNDDATCDGCRQRGSDWQPYKR
jgi:hypothetical protein